MKSLSKKMVSNGKSPPDTNSNNIHITREKSVIIIMCIYTYIHGYKTFTAEIPLTVT